LAETELMIYRILRKDGPVMQRAKLEERCLQEGMSRSTFYVYLDYSPILARYARGVYGLRGATVAPGLIESLIPVMKRRHRVLRDYGWDDKQRIWLAFRVSDGMINSGVFGVPAAMKRFLDGEFSLTTAGESDPVGVLVVRENGAWGLGPFFRRRGVESGDYLVLRFDVRVGSVTAEVQDGGFAEDLDEMREPV
jgi:hypothetical protein